MQRACFGNTGSDTLCALHLTVLFELVLLFAADTGGDTMFIHLSTLVSEVFGPFVFVVVITKFVSQSLIELHCASLQLLIYERQVCV